MPAQQQPTQVELDKIEIDPDFDFREVAKKDLDALTPNEISMFKWSGVYHQLQRGYFMIRLRIPGGVLTAPQLARAGELAKEVGQDSLCITTRQCLQYHWIRLEDIHRVLDGMKAVGITTRNACGDVCRNVVSCSLNGVCPKEIADTASMVMAIADDPVIRDEKRNLPRKHKISVSGCDSACGQALMNCEGWHPVQRMTSDGTMETGWVFTAGGGLGALPHMAKRIFTWVPEALVVPVTRAVIEIHNRYGNRRVRKFARLKIVVAEMGVETFRDTVMSILKEQEVEGIDTIEAGSDSPELQPFPYPGKSVIPQRQEGLNVVRVMIPRSEMSGTEAIRFAKWLDNFGGTDVVFTQRQNLEFRGIPDHQVEDLVRQLNSEGYRTRGFEHTPDIVSCVGTTLCNLAVSDTPSAYRMLMEALADDDVLMEKVGPLRINLNGCPNACGQHWIADIGLRGRRTRGEGGSEEGFSLFAGGRLDANGHIAEHVIDVPTINVVPAVKGLLSLYLEEHAESELFGDYARRLGGSTLGEKLSTRLSAPDGEPIHVRNRSITPSLMQVFEEAKR